VLHHLPRDDVLGFPVWRPLQELRLRRLSGKRQRSQRVHNQVYPQELNGGKWTLLEGQGADQAREKCHDVYRELELEEPPDVIKDITSPAARLDNRREVVVLNDNVRRGMRDLSAGVHCEADVSLPEGWCVVCAVTSDCHDITKLLETRDDDILVIGPRASQYLQLISDVLHFFDIADCLLVDPILEAHDLYLFTRILVFQSTNIVVKFGALHAHALFVALVAGEDAALFGDGNGCDLVVTGDHSDADASVVALPHRLGHFLSNDILDTGNGN